MNNQQSQSTDKIGIIANNAKVKMTGALEELRKTYLYKTVTVAVVLVTGILALGGLYRILAWTMQGWNQLAVTFKN